MFGQAQIQRLDENRVALPDQQVAVIEVVLNRLADGFCLGGHFAKVVVVGAAVVAVVGTAVVLWLAQLWLTLLNLTQHL